MDQLPDRSGDVAAGDATPVLSRREREVLREWLLSDSKQDVAQKLFLSIGTVNTHLLRIRAKYELAGRAASSKSSLLARALQDRIIDLDEL